MTDDLKAYTNANRTAWNASAHLHESGRDCAQMLGNAANPEFSVLDDCLTATLRDIVINGRRAVQVGCNNARELVSLASLGAVPAVGIDQSENFLDQARWLADSSGLSPRFICADIYDLPDDVGQFDLVLITIGVLNWMPDLERFFEIVAGLMAEGAVLVIYETHPILEVFDPASDRPYEPAFSYFSRAPHAVTQAIAYDGKDHGEGETGYWFIHTLGGIVTSCVSAGLVLERLSEHGHSNREADYDLYEDRIAQIPMCYTLVARKPG